MKTVINIKIDQDIKAKAQKLAKVLGLSLSAVVNAQLKQFTREQKLVLEKVPEMSVELEELIGPIELDIKKGRNVSKPVRTSEDLAQYFRSV